MTEIGVRRAPRRLKPVDPTTFLPEIEAALAAFSADVTYAVEVATNAVTALRKRAVYAARREIRAAEKKAHAECEATPAFTCHAISPCGIGDCKFAEGALAQRNIPAQRGSGRRPQAPHDTYSVDAAAEALACGPYSTMQATARDIA